MRYLIDGYNLLHTLGLARKNAGRAGWDRGRRLLLDWLADRNGQSPSLVTVVLDAQNAAGGLIEESHRGLRVVRAGGRTADDLIEDFLKDERSPETVTVVSNDHRVRDAAVRRGCPVVSCNEYVDALLDDRSERPNPTPPKDEKDIDPTPEETDRWLRAFGGQPGR